MAARRASIEIMVQHPGWRKAWPRLRSDLAKLLLAASLRPELKGRVGGSVEVVFADDARLQDLNSRFRGKDKPTNVLSFPNGETPPGGGIALSFETISAEAEGQGKPFIHHSKHMILHGFLHLLGFDHETIRAARLMEGLEIAILSDMGIPNPYLIEAKGRA